MRLIDADALIQAADKMFEHIDSPLLNHLTTYDVYSLINNTPTVETKELKPLVDKVVEILPELTDAIIKELPKIVNGKIKCSECSYYTNTFNGEWVRKEDIIHSIAKQYSDHNEIVPIWLNIGDLKGGTE